MEYKIILDKTLAESYKDYDLVVLPIGTFVKKDGSISVNTNGPWRTISKEFKKLTKVIGTHIYLEQNNRSFRNITYTKKSLIQMKINKVNFLFIKSYDDNRYETTFYPTAFSSNLAQYIRRVYDDTVDKDNFNIKVAVSTLTFSKIYRYSHRVMFLNLKAIVEKFHPEDARRGITIHHYFDDVVTGKTTPLFGDIEYAKQFEVIPE